MTAALLIAFVVGLVAGAGLTAWALLVLALAQLQKSTHTPAAPADRNER